jgi:hypothetical protein
MSRLLHYPVIRRKPTNMKQRIEVQTWFAWISFIETIRAGPFLSISAENARAGQISPILMMWSIRFYSIGGEEITSCVVCKLQFYQHRFDEFAQRQLSQWRIGCSSFISNVTRQNCWPWYIQCHPSALSLKWTSCLNSLECFMRFKIVNLVLEFHEEDYRFLSSVSVKR